MLSRARTGGHDRWGSPATRIPTILSIRHYKPETQGYDGCTLAAGGWRLAAES
jgi:hypothetical protein